MIDKEKLKMVIALLDDADAMQQAAFSNELTTKTVRSYQIHNMIEDVIAEIDELIEED